MGSKKSNLELRMYGLVPYNLSPIQQGIQFGHAVVEYGLKYFKDKDYQDWANNHKTFIILNGGTTSDGVGSRHPYNKRGTMQSHHHDLLTNKIKVETFHEPDLNNAMTAIVFLVDERAFNTEKYTYENFPFPVGIGLDASRKTIHEYYEWEKSPEGNRVKFLMNFLPQFKLA